MRRQQAIALLASLAILGLSGLFAMTIMRGAGREEAPEEHAEDAPPIPVQVATVRSEAGEETLTVTGTLRPVPNGESRVASQVAGRIASVRVRTGDRVRRGQVLVTVSRPDLEAVSRQSEADVRESERLLEALQEERDTRRQSLASQEQRGMANLRAARAHTALVRAGSRPEEIQRAEAALDAAQEDLRRLRAGARPQEIAQAEAAVRDARSERDTRRKEVERKRPLLEKGIVATVDMERAEADLASAEATLDTREQALSLIKEGNRPEEIRAQEARVRDAEAQLRQLKAGARPEEIREANAQLSGAEADLQGARDARSELRSLEARVRSATAHAEALRQGARSAALTYGRRETRSPMDGVVTQVLVGPGDGVSEQTPVAVILNPTAFRAVLEIPAAYRSRLMPGTSATVTVPALPGAEFSGSVRAILDTADPETGLVSTEVLVSNSGGRLTDGMAVNARLRVGGGGMHLFVPTRAVLSREGEHYVYQVEAGEAHEKAVEIGGESEDRTEILKGLRAGDRVVRDGSLSLADGAKVEIRP